MEADELERRIRATQRIVEAVAESYEDYRPLVDTLIPATEFMTREEVIDTLKRVCAAFDQKTLNTIAAQVHHEHTVRNLQRELDLKEERIAQVESDKSALERTLANKDAELSEKDAELSEKDSRIRDLEKQLEDIRHSEATLKKEKFAGKSKRGIEKSKATSRGRDDDKDDFDGTSGSVSRDEEPAGQQSTGISSAPMSLSDLRNISGGRPTKYTLADAARKIVHECDVTRLPEGAVIVPGGESVETVFHEEHVIVADIYKFVKYRIQEETEDEDGNKVLVWREHTVHFPMRETASEEATSPSAMSRGHLPSQVPGTHVTPSMLANLIFEHYFCNVPMNRISKAFGEFGFRIGRSSLEGLDRTTAGLLRPLHKALMDEILCDDAVVFCDETWQRMHLKDKTVKVYDWIIGNRKKKAVAYAYDNGSRGRKVIAEILDGRKVKAIHTDGYNVYFFLKDIGIVQICCGAHLWRKLKEWFEQTNDPEARALLLDLGELFLMEARLRETNAPPEEVLRQRNAPHTLDIISSFTARVDLLLEKCNEIPKIGFRALNYAREIASKVFRWREDADYELDNNFAEQSARPIATSRKTSLFHCSHEGAENDCIIRSFIETCRLRGVSMVSWLKAFFNAVLQGRTDYPNLLPGVLAID